MHHVSRLLTLAQAWRSTQSPMHGKPALLAAILRGLDGWYAKSMVNPNWWWNQIGAPITLGQVLLCIKGACDPSYISRAVPAFTCHQPVLRFTGQNLVWTAGIEIAHGVLTDDPDLVSQGFMLIGREVHVCPHEEGIQPDMTFFQHGRLLYSGGYGQGFAADVARLIWLSNGTAYAFAPHITDLFARYLLDGSRWMVRGQTFEYGAIGREITREGHSAARFFSGVRHMAKIEHSHRAEFLTMAQSGNRAGRSIVNGNRHFWCADLMVHHRPAYYLSVRMSSNRVENADWPCCGGEGRLCHHMADGATFFLCDGDEYRDIFPAWNWRQIPGTTTEQTDGALDPACVRGFGERDFAGGASDGWTGCAGMNFSRKSLAAKKAWFLFDEGVVALGAGITSTSPAPVRTTLNQCLRRGAVLRKGERSPLNDGVHPFNTGAAFWHDGVAYHIMSGSGAMQMSEQAGAWNECGVGSRERKTLSVVNIGLDHGSHPDGATYAYAVICCGDADDALKLDLQRFVIVRNDPRVQAVWHADAKRGQVVFHEAGTVVFPDGQGIGTDKPCIVLYQPNGSQAVLTLADPSQRAPVLTVSLSGPVCAAVSLTLPQREYAGSSIEVIVNQGMAMPPAKNT